MSGYGLLFDSYFTGPTGRAIQAKGKAAVILGAYLGSTRHANIIGLYELPLVYVAHDLPVLGDLATIRAALDDLAEVGYARYDSATDIVWVVEMARIRCGLDRGEALHVRDNRHAGIVRQYRSIKGNAFLGDFFDRYAGQLRLPDRRSPSPSQGASEGCAKPVENPVENGAPTEGLARGSQGDQIRSDQIRSDQKQNNARAREARGADKDRAFNRAKTKTTDPRSRVRA